jgi:hypothetical protein
MKGISSPGIQSLWRLKKFDDRVACKTGFPASAHLVILCRPSRVSTACALPNIVKHWRALRHEKSRAAEVPHSWRGPWPLPQLARWRLQNCIASLGGTKFSYVRRYLQLFEQWPRYGLYYKSSRLCITINHLTAIPIDLVNLRRSYVYQFLAAETFQEPQVQESGRAGRQASTRRPHHPARRVGDACVRSGTFDGPRTVPASKPECCCFH